MHEMRRLSREDLQDKYFPGSRDMNADDLLDRPLNERPYYRVGYRDRKELISARSVQPRHCRVEYVLELPGNG